MQDKRVHVFISFLVFIFLFLITNQPQFLTSSLLSSGPEINFILFEQENGRERKN